MRSPFPSSKEVQKSAIQEAVHYWKNTEEFIEDQYPIDIRYNLEIDCDVSQNGFREHPLRYILQNALPLSINKSLAFRIISHDVPGEFDVKWKVLNRGAIAEQKDMVRGQIVNDGGSNERVEKTSFKGEHIVECYAIKDGIVVAKDRIDVPIQ